MTNAADTSLLTGFAKVARRVVVAVLILCLSSGFAAAQNRIVVKIANRSTDSLYITIFDEICGVVVFSGSLSARATIARRFCADRDRKAYFSVQHYSYGKAYFRDIGKGQTVGLRYLRRFPNRHLPRSAEVQTADLAYSASK